MACRLRGRYDICCVGLFLIPWGTVALFDTWTSFSRLRLVRNTHLIDLLPVSTSKTLRSGVLLVHAYRGNSSMVASSCHHFLLLNSQQGVIVLTTSFSFWILSLMPALSPHFTHSWCLCRLRVANCIVTFGCGCCFLLRAHFRAIVVTLDGGLDRLSCVESSLGSSVSLLHMVWVELWRVWCLWAKDKCWIKLHVLEVTELLLDTLRSVLIDWLVRWLHHGHWASCELLVLQVRVVWRCYLWRIDRGEPLCHHLSHLYLLVAVDLLEEAWQLLGHVHLLRLGYELVDFKRVVSWKLGAIWRWYFRV